MPIITSSVSVGGRFLEGFYATFGATARGKDGGEVGAKFGDFAVGQPSDQIEPMRADVGNRAEFTAEFCFEAPIPVRRKQQPVLQETAVNKFDLADDAFADEHARFLAQRVIAKVVGNGADAAGFLQE